MDAHAVATGRPVGNYDGFIRLGGIAGLLVTIIGAIINLALAP